MVSDFEDTSRSLMDEYLSWDPSFATQVGWHRYDHVLRDLRSDAVSHQIERCSEILRLLKSGTDDGLSEDQRLDKEVAVFLFELKRHELAELRLYERFASACQEVGYSLFFLSSREIPSFDVRLESMTCRIERIPELIAASRETLSRPYRAWNEAAREVGEEIPSLIRSVQTLGKSKSTSTSKRLSVAAKAAAEAVEEYNDWISEDVIPQSSEEYAVASHEYSRLLDLKNYGVKMDQALEIGETYLQLSKEKMASIAKDIVSSGEVSEAVNVMKSDHPGSFAQALQEYRSSAQSARNFVIDHDLATLPSNESLLVVETPQFMRPMFPYAGQFEPGKFDDSRTGFFLVTPDEANPASLREHSHAGIVNTTVHEGYPGHHIQGLCANTHPSNIRILVQSPDFSEGWGLYVEEMMNSQGYASTSLGRLTIENDLLFRACRLVVEIRLSKGEMTIEEGADLFMRECGVDRTSSAIEARNCAMSPTYFCSYLLGKLGIMQLREEAEELLGDRFSLKFFHDALLYTGCLPMPFMRKGLSLKMKRQYDVELAPEGETLYEYAMRRASGSRS